MAHTSRPDSAFDVATAVQNGQSFDFAVREFLDAFYESDADDRAKRLAEEPSSIASVEDAYLGAVAEHLSLRFALPIPPWTEASGRFLDRPFFAGGMEGLKALLIVESPLAFRRRLIFVSHDALSRPRDPALATLD